MARDAMNIFLSERLDSRRIILPNISRVAELNGKVVGQFIIQKAKVVEDKPRKVEMMFSPLEKDGISEITSVCKNMLEDWFVVFDRH